MLTPGRKGAIAETAFAAHATRLGFEVYRPVAEGGRFDMILVAGKRLLRVQCKWGDVRAASSASTSTRFVGRRMATYVPSTPPIRSTRSACTARRLTVATFCR